MNLETFKDTSRNILDCKVKDSQGLNDFQKLPDTSAIAIDEVGIERFRIPLSFTHADDTIMNHDCEASMFVYLEAGKTGVNMSRFCAILQEEANNGAVDNKFIKNVLYRFRRDLRDYDHEDLIPESRLDLKLSYPMKQKSLKSDNWGWQYYDIVLSGLQKGEQSLLEMTLKYEYSSTCPCSLSMAKQYEQDYREGRTQEGRGIATAHSQRSIASITTLLSLDTEFKVEELIHMARLALPTETQSLVKRIDEQAFAILNGDHPMFVEHSTRRLSAILDNDDRILNWVAKVEHLESLHSHNAVATIRKQKPKLVL